MAKGDRYVKVVEWSDVLEDAGGDPLSGAGPRSGIPGQRLDAEMYGRILVAGGRKPVTLRGWP